MSDERIIRTLKELGLSNIDVKLYVLLAKDGPHSEREIIEILELQKQQVNCSLKRLQSIEIVKAIGENLEHYAAMSFEEVIDLFIEVKKEQAKTMRENREELLSSWRETIKKEIEKNAKF